MTPREFVVTYRLEFSDGSVEVCEMFRGTKAECQRIWNHSGEGSCDRKQVVETHVLAGPAKEWDAYMDEIAAQAEEI